MADETCSTAASPPPPLPQRRPRVREVSSRFMSPLIHSNSTPIPTPITSDARRSKSAHRRQTTKADENLIPEPNRVSDKPSTGALSSTVHRKHHQQIRAKHQISENGESNDHHHPEIRASSRPDTPAAERIVPSRYRQVSNPNTIHRSSSLNGASSNVSSAAARLLHEATTADVSKISTSSSDDSDSCSTTSSINMPDNRSSMRDGDNLATEKNNENSSKFTSDCARSLNFSCSSLRPPHPLSSSVRSVLEVRKGRKVCNQQDGAHCLKMLSNHYLQWRFVNAKAEAMLRAQKQEAERKLCSLGGKISDVRDNMRKKSHECTLFRGVRTLITIVDSQMPYLDEWSTLEEDYSNSLSGTTNALLSASVRLPVSPDVRGDAGQLREALNSAITVLELICSQIQRFIQKGKEMDISISGLAQMVSGEKARIEECGYMLSKTYSSQVKECSLRGTLMQLNYSNQHQPQKMKSEATA